MSLLKPVQLFNERTQEEKGDDARLVCILSSYFLTLLIHQ